MFDCTRVSVRSPAPAGSTAKVPPPSPSCGFLLRRLLIDTLAGCDEMDG